MRLGMGVGNIQRHFPFQIGVNRNGQDLHSLHLNTDELHMLFMTLMPCVQFRLRAAQCASNKGHW